MIVPALKAGRTQNGQPQAFDEFLLKVPNMFKDLGDRLGGVPHIISFWRFPGIATRAGPRGDLRENGAISKLLSLWATEFEIGFGRSKNRVVFQRI